MKWFRKIALHTLETLCSDGGQGVLFGGFVLVLIALFLIPLPTPLLDVLISLNILVSLVLLLRAVFLRDIKQFFFFPAVLLFTTLYRLGLNVSSTRLILLSGDQGLDAAGHVIESFGSFVVQGDFIVGAIIFAVIAVINFLVIAKGSARVAEVAARFALDALPGRQLAIDSDLRAGNLTKEEAFQRRNMLSRESQFFGAMDGAMKFVQGDAIATVIIALINAFGGVAIGMTRGQSFSDAVNTFGVLSIGDGLVSIVPSLLISVCAGTIVTHVSGQGGNARPQLAEFVSDPRPFVLGAIALLLIGCIPQFPFLPFAVAAGLLLTLTFAYQKYSGGPGRNESGLAIDPLRSRVGWQEKKGDLDSGMIAWSGGRVSMLGSANGDSSANELPVLQPLVLELDKESLGKLFSETAERGLQFHQFANKLREEQYKKRGFIIPAITVRLSDSLEPGGYRVFLRELPVRGGILQPKRVFVTAAPSTLQMLALPVAERTVHPWLRTAAAWINETDISTAALAKLNVAAHDTVQFLVLEVFGAAFEYAEEMFGVDEAKGLVNELKKGHPELVEEIFQPGKLILSYSELADLLRRLIREHVSIRDLKLILEGVAEYQSNNPEREDVNTWLSGLHGFIRVVLSRTIVNDATGVGGQLRTFVLGPEVEEEFRAAMSVWDNHRTRPPIDPEIEKHLRQSAQRMFLPVIERGAVPIVVLCSQSVRPAVQEFFGQQLPGSDWFRTLAFEELGGSSKPESVGVIALEQ